MLYLDHAATTPLDPRVLKIIQKNQKIFGNASSPHIEGERAHELLKNSRRKVAQALKVKPGEIIFTSSGTESANLALFGVSRANQNKGKHIITSNIEHLAVLNSCEKLKKEGFSITYIKAKENGIVDPNDIKKSLRKNTILVSIIHANNEIGTIQPLRIIGNIISKFRDKTNKKYPYFHSDACQAAGAINMRPHDIKVDLLTLNGSKIYGPKGTGCLFVKRGIPIEPIIFGGSQERGLRAGTENVVLLSGFAKALEIAERSRKNTAKKEEKLRDFCIKNILKEISNSKLNGHPKKRLPNNINLSFGGIDGEMLMFYLDEKKIQVSTGSACTTSETGPSHVMKAIKNPKEWGNIRVTLGRNTTKKEMDYFIEKLKESVKKLRSL